MTRGVILAHGGAGDIPDSRVEPKLQGLREAVMAGYRVVCGVRRDAEGTDVALKAAAATVAVMEDDWVFNAGYGSVLNELGKVQMDAAVMEGKDLNYGGVVSIENFKNPILVSERIAVKSPHCLFSESGARKFALENGFEELPEGALVSPQAIEAQQHYLQTMKRMVAPSRMSVLKSDEGIIEKKSVVDGKRGTVGAVVHFGGHLAAATSTGGLVGKALGRIGDSPVIGAGLYADDKLGAVSTTGIGESLLRYSVAFRIASAIGQGKNPNESIMSSLSAMTDRVGGDGGAICISPEGSIGIEFNSTRMAWAYIKLDECQDGRVTIHSGCNRGEDFVHVEKI